MAIFRALPREQASLTVPPEAYELHMAFSDGGGTWDNNAGANFYARVRMGMSAEQLAATLDKAVQEGASWGNVQVGVGKVFRVLRQCVCKRRVAKARGGGRFCVVVRACVFRCTYLSFVVLGSLQVLSGGPFARPLPEMPYRFPKIRIAFQDIAHRRGGSKFFTTPEVLLAGEPAVLYVNRRRCVGLEQNPNLRLHLGFNGWSTGGQELSLKPTNLWRGEDIDWWELGVIQGKGTGQRMGQDRGILT